MSEKPNESVIERVRKLLSRTVEKGCTEAEAAAAFAMAGKLMAAHNLDMAAVEAAGEASEDWVTEHGLTHQGRRNPVLFRALNVCQNYFFVRTFTKAGRTAQGRCTVGVFLFGKPSNVETSRWVLASLLAACDRLWLEHRGRSKGRGAVHARRDFGCGVCDGFSRKLAEERRDLGKSRDAVTPAAASTATALAVIGDKLELAMDAAYPKMAESRPLQNNDRDQATYRAGVQAGKNLNLNRELAGEETKALTGR